MIYQGKQLAALVKMGISMAAADGRFAEEEKMAIVLELASFGVSPDDAANLLAASEMMDASEALSLLSSMSNEQKRYATGYLAAIMAADGEIADSEVKLWQLICTLGNFPSMNIAEALRFWHNN